jgi:hypothetical protein
MSGCAGSEVSGNNAGQTSQVEGSNDAKGYYFALKF